MLFYDYMKVDNISVPKKVVVEMYGHTKGDKTMKVGETSTYTVKSAELIDFDEKIFKLQYLPLNTGVIDSRKNFMSGKEPLNYAIADSSKSLDQTSMELYKQNNGNYPFGRVIFKVIITLLVIAIIFLIFRQIKKQKRI